MASATEVEEGTCPHEGESWDVVYDPRDLVLPKCPVYGNILNPDQLLLLGPRVGHSAVTLRNSLSASQIVAPLHFRCPKETCTCRSCSKIPHVEAVDCVHAAAKFREYVEREFASLEVVVKG